MVRLWFLLLCVVSATFAAVTPAEVRSASERAIVKLQDSMAVWDQKRDCVSCHHQSLMMIAMADANERGVAVDTTRLQKSFDHAYAFLSNPDRAIQGTHDIDLPISELLGMWAATRLGLPASFTVQANVKRMARWQLPDGHWSTIDMRPPQSFSRIGATAYAILELKQLASPMMKAEVDERIERARQWLASAKPRETGDRTLRMMGLYWAGAPVKQAADELLSQQRKDGGWGQLTYLDSDAFSTGDVLASLAECGAISTSAPQYQAGLRYLLRTQDAVTGLWHVKTRLNPPTPVSPEYLETGLPWEHDQFISAMGTARAVSALVMTLEKSPGGTPLSFAVAVPKQVPDWARKVMFGGAPELRPMLDSGFDPNSATAGGTTVLMIAAADADKVKLLLERGAQVNAKAKTRYTALMAAAAYNSVESAKLLLDRGAEPSPSKAEPAQFGMSPTFFAIWSGNLTLAALLMDRGGDPQVPMLLGGGFFGSMRPLDVASEHYDAPMVKLLSEHRINLNEGDAMNGLTPIEWAAIMDDLPQARVVLAAGADVNHMDKLGWTALQWAANIDHGDSEMIKFLLANGARRDLKNKEGQTALEVAKKYGYKRHVAVLERVERAER